MTESLARVCPRCGAEALQNPYCATCGLHLAELPELPTYAQWQARENRTSPPESTDRSAAPSSGPTTLPPRDEPKTRHSGWRDRLSPRARVSVLMAVAVIIALAVAVAVTGDDDEGSSASSPSTAAGNAQADADVCAERWNSGATEGAKRIVGLLARDLQGGSAPVYVSAGYSADVPDRCLITAAQPDHPGGGTVHQFVEKAGGTFDFPTSAAGGSVASLPESTKQWNAQADESGDIAVGAP